jgi:hypothetical protein
MSLFPPVSSPASSSSGEQAPLAYSEVLSLTHCHTGLPASATVFAALSKTTMPTSTSPPAMNKDNSNIEPAVSLAASEEEIKEYERRQTTLAARKARRRALGQYQMLEDERSALRTQVAHMRAAHADFGLPPVPPPKRQPYRSPKAYLPPKPALNATESDPIQRKRQQGALACWRSRKRKMQQLLKLEDQVACLKMEIAELRRQRSAFVFRARL